jgi:hypothetical protein
MQVHQPSEPHEQLQSCSHVTIWQLVSDAEHATGVRPSPNGHVLHSQLPLKHEQLELGGGLSHEPLPPPSSPPPPPLSSPLTKKSQPAMSERMRSKRMRVPSSLCVPRGVTKHRSLPPRVVERIHQIATRRSQFSSVAADDDLRGR